MSDTSYYEIPFGTSDLDLAGGSELRRNIAQTFVNELGKRLSENHDFTDSSSGIDFGSETAYQDLMALDPVPNELNGIYNALQESYYNLSGEEKPWTSNEEHLDGVNYDTMSVEDFRSNFAAGSSSFDRLLGEKATEITGEINALRVGASSAAPGATSQHTPGTKEWLDEADKYKDAHNAAILSGAGTVATAPDSSENGAVTAALSEFKEQCFLLSHVIKFVDYKLRNVGFAEPKLLPYQPTKNDSKPTNACLMVQTEPYGFINKLTQYSSQSTLNNLRPDQIAALVPKIRLFKVYEDDSGREVQQEFRFAAFAEDHDINFALQDRRKRGVGVGIKDFTFSYEGSNPFSVKKSIKASLELFAASFDELFKVRGSALEDKYRYVDLALKTGGPGIQNSVDPTKATVEFENLENLNFRIKAVVGWQAPPGNSSTSKELAAAVNNSFVTLNLTPTIHKFNINDDGSVKFVCQYLAYIENHFDHQMFNVFFGTEKTFKRQLERKLTLASLSQNCDSGQMEKVQEKLDTKAKNDLHRIASSIIQRLLDRDTIRFINIPMLQLQDLNSNGPYAEWSKILKKTSTKPPKSAYEKILSLHKKGKKLTYANKQEILNMPPFSMRPDPPGKKGTPYSLGFFYVSDLLDTILEGISERLDSADVILSELATEGGDIDPEIIALEKREYAKQKKAFRKLRVLLGPIEIVNRVNPSQSKFVNIGDLPISIKYFIEWMSKQTINKASVSYPLARFLNQFFKDFVNTFLNDDTCFEGKVRQRTTLSQTAITAYTGKQKDLSDTITTAIYGIRRSSGHPSVSRLDLDNVWPYYSDSPGSPWPVLNLSGLRDEPITEAGPEREINFLTYYAGRTHPVEKQNGNLAEDLAMGIQHYAIGKDRGLVKNIRMTTTDIPYLKELRFAREGYDGLEQLREVYDVNIDCYANVNTFPGTYIYIDPKGWSPQTEFVTDKQLNELKKISPALWKAVKQQDLTRFGIGGYYMIKRSEHSFGPGKAQTTIQAQWTHHTSGNSSSDRPGAPDKKDSSKCPVGNKSANATPDASTSQAARLAAKNETHTIAMERGKGEGGAGAQPPGLEDPPTA